MAQDCEHDGSIWMLAGCREFKDRRPRPEPWNVRRPRSSFTAKPRRWCRAKAGSFSAQELVIPTVTDEHCVGSFRTELLHRLKVDVRLRLRGSDLEREHGCVKQFSRRATWPCGDIFGEAIANEGQLASLAAQFAKNLEGDWIELLKHRSLLKTTFVADAPNKIAVDATTKRVADFKQG